MGYSPQSLKESDMTEQLTLSPFTTCREKEISHKKNTLYVSFNMKCTELASL